MNRTALVLRRLAALVLLALSIGIWTRHSDVLALIVQQRPVLFGRYSQGHFGALLLLTPILWTLAAACWSRRPLGQALGNGLLGIGSTIFAMLAITYLAHFFHGGARYVEAKAADGTQVQLPGLVRHRPPNQVYELVYADRPEQIRSYPDAPPGYPDVPVKLTSDANGFRNPQIYDQYDILAVGDSFVAGSNVSDGQSWPALLGRSSGRAIYNLGVGGSGPPTYLSNYATFGLRLKPKVALFMIYEGNDFKEDVVFDTDVPAATAAATGAVAAGPSLGRRLQEHIDFAFHSSPVTLGLKRLSNQVFEKAGAQRPVPDYREKIGFMPLRVQSGDTVHYYSFEPKRLIYLNYSREQFSTSPEWRATAKMLERIAQLSRDNGIRPIFLYAPSAPHVVLPLVEEQIPAGQLRTFTAYRKKHLPDAETFKREVFANLDSEEQVVMDFCRGHDLDCLSLTPALRAATAAGTQTYFTYDQHWTPDGNAVAAAAIEKFLREKGVL